MTPRHYSDPFDAFDDEIPYPDWMEEDLYHDRFEESYNEMLMDGGDL